MVSPKIDLQNFLKVKIFLKEASDALYNDVFGNKVATAVSKMVLKCTKNLFLRKFFFIFFMDFFKIIGKIKKIPATKKIFKFFRKFF